MIDDPLFADSAMESAIKELRQHIEDEAFAAMSRAAKEVYESYGLELMDDPLIYRCIFDTAAAHSEEVGHRLALRGHEMEKQKNEKDQSGLQGADHRDAGSAG